MLANVLYYCHILNNEGFDFLTHTICREHYLMKVASTLVYLLFIRFDCGFKFRKFEDELINFMSCVCCGVRLSVENKHITAMMMLISKR